MPILFDGTDDLVTASNSASVKGLTKASVSIWYASNGAPSVNAPLYYESTNTTVKTRLGLFHLTTGEILLTARDTEAGAAFSVTSSAGAPTDGSWHHYAGTYNSDTEDMILYVDGASDGTDSTAKGAFTNTDPVDGIRFGGVPGTPLGYINGSINEPALWNTALTGPEVARLYNSEQKRHFLQVQHSGLIEGWPFDDGPNGTSADGDTITGIVNGYNGTGDDGANNTGLTWKAEELLSYPSSPVYVAVTADGVTVPLYDHHYRMLRAA
jgi:hypothetical protein